MDNSNELIRIGDFICLYSEDAEGFIYSDDSSAMNKGLRVYSGQNKDGLNQISNVHVVSFQILTQNRYKLTKTYRKLQNSLLNGADVSDSTMESAKLAADAELKDNLSEQKRLLGRPIYYGDIVQLRHVFTEKFISMSTTETSEIDKNKMMVCLQNFSSKHAQFRVIPRYKVKVEGEQLEVDDQIVLESVKAPGNYLHMTANDNDQRQSEVNCGTYKSVLTVLKYYSPNEDNDCLRGGAIVQFFHKDCEAYIAAEGVFGEQPTEQAHLRVRAYNRLDLRSLLPPKNCGTYWQIIHEDSAISGDAIKWEDNFHICHMTTRLYLTISEDGKGSLTDEASEDTLFTFSPLTHGPHTVNVAFNSTVRILHVTTESWMHSASGLEYTRLSSEDGDSLETLHWDNSPLLQLRGSTERMFPDAFILKAVEQSDISSFNYVSGLIPFARELKQMKQEGGMLTARDTLAINKTFDELEMFTSSNEVAEHRSKQNVLRHTKLIDILVELLQCPLDGKDRRRLLQVYKNIYDVLYYYASSRGIRNMLYGARFINVLQTQLHLPQEVGLMCCLTMIELVTDNRTVIDRIKQSHVQNFINLLVQYKESYFLDLLSTVCVCNGIAITENQTHIVEALLLEQKGCLFALSPGKIIGKQTHDLYISTNGEDYWQQLHDFLDIKHPDYSKTKYDFFMKQLQLLVKLCAGKNARAKELITQSSDVFPWDVALKSLQSKKIPYKVRAQFCDAVLGVYFNGEDTSAILQQNNFIFSAIDPRRPMEDENGLDIDEKFPGLWNWMKNFFANNPKLLLRHQQKNIYIKEVLELLTKLSYLGYVHKERDLKEIKSIIMNYLKIPKEMPIENTETENTENEPTETSGNLLDQSKALIDVQLEALDLVELLMIKQFTRRLKYVIAEFKETDIQMREEGICRIRKPKFARLMISHPNSNFIWDRLGLRLRIERLLKNMCNKADFIGDEISGVLFNLCSTNSDEMKRKCLSLLNKYYSSKHDLLKRAMRSQLLVSEVSESFHEEAVTSIPELRFLAMSKVDEEGFEKLCSILDQLICLCYVKDRPEIPHTVGQNILVNNGILDVILELVTQEVDPSLQDRFQIRTEISKKALILLRYLAQGNGFVQDWIFDNIERLLYYVPTSGSECALAIMEAFQGRALLCLKIQPNHMKRIVEKCGQHKEKEPEWLLVLKTLVKGTESGIIIRRNQEIIAKALIAELSNAAYPMEMQQQERLAILYGEHGLDSLQYYELLAELFATCAEGDNALIESLCQKMLSLSEILLILNSHRVSITTKCAFTKFLVWGYINITRSPIEIGAEELCHDSEMWKLIKTIDVWMKSASDMDNVQEKEDIMMYMVTIGFILLKGFFGRIYEGDVDYPNEANTLQNIAVSVQKFCTIAVEYATTPEQIEMMSECLNVLVTRTAMEEQAQVSKKFYQKAYSRKVFDRAKKSFDDDHKSLIYDEEEKRINDTFHGFCGYLYDFTKGKNTVGFQRNMLGVTYETKEYTTTNHDVPLPLGGGYQDLINCFIETKYQDSKRRYGKAFRLVEQLGVSHKNWSKTAPAKQEELDLKSLQILRAMLHNLIVILPGNWSQNAAKWKSSLTRIENIQETFNNFGIVGKILPLMSRYNVQFGKQIFALLDLLLFNANKSIQASVYNYFTGTQEEHFFVFTQTTLQMAVSVIKERRNMANQQKARSEALKKMEENRSSIEKYEEQNGNVVTKSKMKGLSKFIGKVTPSQIFLKPSTVTIEDKLGNEINEDKTAINDMQMIMRVAGGLCDGQYKNMQDYFKYQPDNINSVDIVAEFTHLVSVVYSHVDSNSIGVCSDLFSTLHEMCEGNTENRLTMLNNKIVDYINLLLRKRDFEGCSLDQVLELRMQMGQLLYSLVEEGTDTTARDVCQMVSLDDLKYIVAVCYAIPFCNGNISSFTKSMSTKEMDQLISINPGFFSKRSSKNQNTDLIDLGFLYYYLIVSLYDIDSSREQEGYNHPMEELGYMYFHRHCRSVELLKDGQLEKKHFRVRNPNLLREEMKITIKYDVDRTSPTGKLRDLLNFSKDILKDIDYQKRIHKSWLISQLAKRWQLWNYLCIFLSLVINVLMLISWRAPYTTADIPENATSIPANSSIHSIHPDITVIPEDTYYLSLYILGGIHCFSSSMLLLGYLLLYHPALPTWITRCYSKSKENDNQSALTLSAIKRPPSSLQDFLISGATLYYLVLLSFSILGLRFYGYFFAFHLFSIIDNNPLLQGVIKAVTLNGKSLIWVAILGLIVLYVFTLVSFAFFRPSFTLVNPGAEMFCATLYECFVSIIRYGTVGDINGSLILNQLDITFKRFGYISLFQVLFFIIFTTILLNVIFGIIVDTFSQIRDTKDEAEADMKDKCFICSRDSFDFEHYSKGFNHHVREEHNMWAYIFYFIYLHETEEKDYTAIDMHVANLVKRDDLSFFPLNCALSLSSKEEDSDGDQLNILMEKVNNLEKQNAFQAEMLKKLLQKFSKDDKPKKKWKKMRSERKRYNDRPGTMSTISRLTDSTIVYDDHTDEEQSSSIIDVDILGQMDFDDTEDHTQP